MVNYCCVEGCNRNSRNNKNLNFYSIPKDLFRREQWLQAAGREDLMNKVPIGSTRFCSRHFPPTQTKRKYLSPDAVPSRNLPGSGYNNDKEHVPAKHMGVKCNGCTEPVFGFRYKCIVCQDYDLCQKCEMHETHPQHLMLRISEPMKFMKEGKLLTKLRDLLKSESSSDYNSDNDSKDYESSDDEPITKYAKDNNDSGVDLPDDVKKKIRNEVAKFAKVIKNQNLEQTVAEDNVKKRASEVNRCSKRLRGDGPSNNEKADDEIQELAFADVGDVKLDNVVKNEPVCTIKDDKPDDIYTLVIVDNGISEAMIKEFADIANME